MNFPTSQTPPPPSPGQQMMPATMAQEPAGPGLSEAQRLVNVFIAPRKTFGDLKRNPSWWMPWLVSALFTVGAAFVIVQKVDIPRLSQSRTEKSKFAQQRMEQVPPEQREQSMRLQATILKVQYFIRPVFSLLIGLLAGAILMAIFNFILGAEIPFQRATAVVFYAFLPSLIKIVLLCLTLFLNSDPGGIDPDVNAVATNPGFFMDPQGNKFIYFLASGFDIIAIWITILLAIGFATASSNRKPSLGAALVTMFVIHGILVLGGALIASALS